MEANETTPSPSIPNPETFLDSIVSFPDGSTYERLRPITDYRRDPGEARILFICKRKCIHDSRSGIATSEDDRELIMKIKVQYVTLLQVATSPPLTWWK